MLPSTARPLEFRPIGAAETDEDAHRAFLCDLWGKQPQMVVLDTSGDDETVRIEELDEN